MGLLHGRFLSSCCFLRDEVDVQAAARRDEASFVPAAASVLSLLGRSKRSSRKRKEGFLRDNLRVAKFSKTHGQSGVLSKSLSLMSVTRARVRPCE